MRILHVQRVEDALLNEVVERHAGDDFDDSRDHIESTTVTPACSRLKIEGPFGNDGYPCGQRVVLARSLACFTQGFLPDIPDRMR